MAPCFTSRAFAKVHAELPDPGGDWTSPARFNLARPGGLRRSLSIPNPKSQLLLSKAIADGWQELSEHYEKSPISISRPVRDQRRALQTRLRFHDRPTARAKRMHRARFSVLSDISQYYGSIYTHSIPWALHTREAEKDRLKNHGPKRLGNLIDDAVRHGQEGQTKGIPVGPDTSLAISEVLLCSIDQTIVSALPHLENSSLRFMDDVEFYVRSRSQAEEVLLRWEAHLATYELLVNPAKTEIVEGPISIERPWRSRLAQFVIREETDRKKGRDIREYLGVAFDLARDFPSEPVISYAISRLARSQFGDFSWNAFSELLMPSAIAEPSSLRYVEQALRFGAAAGREIDRTHLSEAMSDLVAHHAFLEHGAEVSWALWIISGQGAKLTLHAAEQAARMADNASLILLLHLAEEERIEGEPDLTGIESKATEPDSLSGRDWLLAYECAAQGWVSPDTVNGDPFFLSLLERDVVFFDPSVVIDLHPSLDQATLDPDRSAEGDGGKEGDKDAPESEEAAEDQDQATEKDVPDDLLYL